MITKAAWPAIVDQKTFAKVGQRLKANYRRNKTRTNNRYPFLLSGLTVCGQCGDRLPGKSAHGNGGKIPYYEHGWAVRRQAFLNKKIFSCEPHRVLAKKLEPLVWGEVIKLLTNPDVSASLIKEAQKIHEKKNRIPEANKLKNKVRGIEDQIEALAEHLTKIPKSVSPAPVYVQMQRLQELREATQKQIQDVAVLGGTMDEPIAIKDYQAYLDVIRNILSTTEDQELKTKIVQRLIHKVEVLPRSFRIHYYVGKGGFVPTDWESEPQAAKDKKRAANGGLSSNPSGQAAPFLVTGSNTVDYGRPAGIRTPNLRIWNPSL